MMIRQFDTQNKDFSAAFNQLIHFEDVRSADVEARVAEIIATVRKDGDAALVTYTKEFDNYAVNHIAELEISLESQQQAFDALDTPLKEALITTRSRLEEFHRFQLERDWSVKLGNGRYGQRITPVERAGLYVPGGKAAYPSSILMNAVPAKVAGVTELIMVTPQPKGRVNETVLAAAHIAGIDRVFAIGGAQAIAALAYGTETIPRVDVITGPGNIYVATAKRQVFGVVGIDMIAGPSEVVIIADEDANPDWITYDLFAQAEHDEEAQSILITPSEALIDAVQASIAKKIETMPRKDIIATSLRNRGALIHTADLTEAVELANIIAPEHLQLQVDYPDQLLPIVKNAGAIFMGYSSAEVFGDYCAGPNHVLPTSGSARFSSPLGVYNFVKRSSILDINNTEAKALSATAAIIAEAEGLIAHQQAALARNEKS